MGDALRRAFADPGVPSGLRFMSRGFIRWPATVMAVVLAGTVIYGGITRLGPETFDRGTEHFGPEALQDRTPGTGSPAAAPTGTAEPGPTAPGGATQSPRPGATRDPGGGEGFAWSVPAEGVYRYAVSGSENVNVTGPACSRRYEAGRITVVHLEEGVQADTEYINDDGSVTHTERRILTYAAEGVHIEHVKPTVVCIQRREEPADYRPPLEFLRFPLTVGSRWSGRTESVNPEGEVTRTTDYTAEVLRTETLSAAGRTFDTFVVRILATFEGQQEGERGDTLWFDPRLGMLVKHQESTEASQGAATFRQGAMWTLTSLP